MDPSLSYLENYDSVAQPSGRTSTLLQSGVRMPVTTYEKILLPPIRHSGIPVRFIRTDGLYISVREALNEDFASFVDEEITTTVEPGSDATFQILWLGYKHWYAKWSVAHLRAPPSPNKISIPLSKLATEAAKAVDKFVKEMESVDIAPENASWKVGTNGIPVEGIYLAGLEEVSPGAWRIQLFHKLSK